MNLFFARVLGINNLSVKAKALAGRVPVVSTCIFPWAVQAVTPNPEGDYGLDLNGNGVNDEVFIFQDSSSDWATPGNYGALAVYGGGTNIYRNSIKGDCGAVNACDSDSPFLADGQYLSCDSQTGALGQNTHSALSERYPSATWAQCDVETDGDAYAEAQAKAEDPNCVGRAVPIAIIDHFPPQGQSASILIYGLATFYIAEWDRQAPWGNGDTDGEPPAGMVWGYLIPTTSVPAWKVQWSLDSTNPFAPDVIALLE